MSETSENSTPSQGARSDQESSHVQQTDHKGYTEALGSGLCRWEEFCLVKQYVTATHKDVTRSEREAEAWRDTPFQDGWRYSFILDAILALTALHRAYTTSGESDRFVRASLYYQSSGLRTFTQHLSDITASNCHAMFAFAAIINIAVIAVSRGGVGVSPTAPIDTLFTIYELGNGLKAVIDSSLEMLTSGPYKAAFATASTLPKTCASETVARVFQAMRQQAESVAIAIPDNRAETYLATIDRLEEAFMQVEEHKDFGAILAWIMGVPNKAIQLLEIRDPMMCLIFMHYGVLYLHLHDKWWANGFGARLIWDMSSLLHAADTAWVPLTSWARVRANVVCDGGSVQES